MVGYLIYFLLYFFAVAFGIACGMTFGEFSFEPWGYKFLRWLKEHTYWALGILFLFTNIVIALGFSWLLAYNYGWSHWLLAPFVVFISFVVTVVIWFALCYSYLYLKGTTPYYFFISLESGFIDGVLKEVLKRDGA